MIQRLCPVCGVVGKRVKSVTPRCLLVSLAKERLAPQADLRFCRTKDCEVVYFGAGHLFRKSDLTATVFQKSDDPSRLVCYCFGHTVASIRNEVERVGMSCVPDSVATLCKQGLDACPEKNPQGSCCLGNIRQVIKQMMLVAEEEDSQSLEKGCCS